MENSKESFLSEMDEILDEFFEESSEYPSKLKRRTTKMIDYTIPNYDKCTSPILTLKIAKIIKPSLTNDELQMACSLGWIYQLFEAYIVVQDDFIDDGDQRRQQISWSKLHTHSKSIVVYDQLLLRALAFYTLKRNFSHSVPVYLQLVDLFIYLDNITLRGNILDVNHSIENVREGKIELASLNMEAYNKITSLKSSGFFYMPIGFAMTITGFQLEKNGEVEKNIKTICCDIGRLAQAMDDYYDIFPHSTKSMATSCCDGDIKRGQFSWLFLVAKEKCTNVAQFENLVENYGKDDDECVANFKAFLESIGIHDLFESFCKEEFGKIMKKVDTFFVDEKVVHKIMTWYIPAIKSFLTDEIFGNYC